MKMPSRRPLLALFALAGLLVLGMSSNAGAADAYPSKPIRIIVGYGAGGAVDLIARSVGQRMASTLGQPVIVENKPGAGTNIAVKALITSPSDGYTLMLAANALAVNPALFQPAPYNLERDLTPVSLVGRVPVVAAVREGSEFKTLQQLVAAAKAKPGAISVATPGNGSTPHLAMELFQHTAGLSLRHVPYKGGSQALTDVMGGHVDVVAVNALEAAPLAKAGTLRVLALMSPERAAVLPGVPTVAESGYPGFEASVWYGFVAPAGLPQPIQAKLHEAVQKALESAEVRDQLAAAGGVALPGPTAQFDKLLKSEAARYGKLIREANIKPD
ncbi:tripartite tricarboxylate transporter substrate binding protein [Variovorax sp. J22G21]|uniref:Bug family tripartite tricarboxylate transporter substrate binding protein n=1 Tax=Variovorax fucosicus TaxID=3053517 RepID=UPI0025784EAC|nr:MULTISPECIES: tripartite tricarboxylate transporter substrate binding protein [unclassified Variovorax]MDM0037819.1 tripartite tricarboxylate transporter substrate binding protein [Variovorax sp. J22R193]MDM0056512.1 tripartite tricarboxylate transporter substrate binding protein [Variovorax sp. J22G47]MDM0062595.1 tripartite tricarboxylate transporter substrate binding protein [Variovorax sp. J22G21]